MRNLLVEVTPTIPERLGRLPELASNLHFSWHRPTRALFEDLDKEIWRQASGNPRLMLRCVSQAALDRAAADEAYVARYQQVLQRARVKGEGIIAAERDLLQTTHAAVGAYLLRLWGLPDSIVAGRSTGLLQIYYLVFII